MQKARALPTTQSPKHPAGNKAHRISRKNRPKPQNPDKTGPQKPPAKNRKIRAAKGRRLGRRAYKPAANTLRPPQTRCPRGLFVLPAGIPRGEALPRLYGLIRRGAQLLIPGGTAPVSRGRVRACRRDRGLSSRSSDRGHGNRWSPTTNCTRCRRRTAPRPHSPSGRSRGSPGRERRIIVHWMIRYGGVLTTLLGQPV